MGGECRYPQRCRQPADAAGPLYPRPDGHDAEPSAGRVSSFEPMETAAREIRAAAAGRTYFFDTLRLPPRNRREFFLRPAATCRRDINSFQSILHRELPFFIQFPYVDKEHRSFLCFVLWDARRRTRKESDACCICCFLLYYIQLFAVWRCQPDDGYGTELIDPFAPRPLWM